MVFIEAPAFSRYLSSYLKDDEYRQLQAALISDPEAGTVMPQTGGFRKYRWADPRRGKGTRGGLRIIYYHFTSDDQIWFVTLFDKDEMVDLSPAQKRALKEAITIECRVREKARATTPKRGR